MAWCRLPELSFNVKANVVSVPAVKVTADLQWVKGGPYLYFSFTVKVVVWSVL